MEFVGHFEKDSYSYVAEIPFFDVMSQGDTPQQAVEMVVDALQEVSFEYFNRKVKVDIKDIGIQDFTLEAKEEEIPFLFSLALRRLKESSNLTVRKLAEALNTKGPNTVGQYLTGKHTPSLLKFTSLLNAMGKELRIDVRDKKGA